MYALKLYSDVCQLLLNKTGKKHKKKLNHKSVPVSLAVPRRQKRTIGEIECLYLGEISL